MKNMLKFYNPSRSSFHNIFYGAGLQIGPMQHMYQIVNP